MRTVVLIDSVLISQAAVIILSVCYGILSSYLGKAGLASICLSLSFVCALVHLFDVIKKYPYRRPSSYTRTGLKGKKGQAVSRRKVEPWGLVEDCEEETKKEKKGTVRPKCHHVVVRHHRPRAPR